MELGHLHFYRPWTIIRMFNYQGRFKIGSGGGEIGKERGETNE
jgi:hypothetical protein